MIVTITVTEEDIDKGCRRSAFNCPLARAFQRVLRPEMDVTAGVRGFHVGRENSYAAEHYMWVPGTPETKAFIEAFDDRRPVSPFSFSVDIPPLFVREDLCNGSQDLLPSPSSTPSSPSEMDVLTSQDDVAVAG